MALCIGTRNKESTTHKIIRLERENKELTLKNKELTEQINENNK